MLKTLINKEFAEKIQTEYPHLRYPAAVYAKVTGVQEEDFFNVYCIKILDKNRREDHAYPEIPQVKSEKVYHVGDVVAVAMMYGDIAPYIIGGVI